MAEAKRAYGRILKAHPTNAVVLHNLGLIAYQTGDIKAANRLIRKAIRIMPNFAEAYDTLGNVHKEMGELGRAVDAHRKAIALMPELVSAYFNLGNALSERTELAEAAAAYRQAIQRRPDMLDAHYNLGNALKDQGRLDEAEGAYRDALRLDPRLAKAYNNLGNIRQGQGDLAEAELLFREALECQPDLVEAHNNLANVLCLRGREAEAITAFRDALVLDPDDAQTLNNLGCVLQTTGAFSEALAVFRKASDLAPDNIDVTANLTDMLLTSCDFESAAAFGSRILELIAGDDLVRTTWYGLKKVSYLSAFLGFDRTVQVTVQRALTAAVSAESRPADRELAQVGVRGSRIRIGYVSPCFGDHPVGHVTRQLYVTHDRDDFEVYGYSLKDRSAETAPYHREIRDGCDHFVELAELSNDHAAERIAADQIDILIDLNGYLEHSRPQIFARRPAPVQVFWLGHAGGLGYPWIDYLIADHVVLPRDEEASYSESIVRLPELYHPTDTHEISDVPVSRREFGLKDEAIVFCGFNNAQKIDQRCFELWMRILSKVPDSQLWLSNQKDLSPPKANLQSAAERYGVDPSRLVFATRVPDKTVHLARHSLADLFLDTLTVNAATTAIDALWAGLPMVTCRGPTFSSRMATTLLFALGLDELVTESLEEYEERVIALASSPSALAALKAQLWTNRTTHPLFDIQMFVRHLEDAFRTMWNRHSAGDSPEGFDVVPRSA